MEARHAGRAAITRSPVVGPGGPSRWPPRHVLGGPLPGFSGKSAGGRGRGGSRQGARGGAAAAAGIEGRRRAADTRAPAPSRRWDHARACVAHSPLCATPPRRSAGPTGAATRGSHAAGWREALGHRLSPPSVCHHPKRGNNGLRRQFLWCRSSGVLAVHALVGAGRGEHLCQADWRRVRVRRGARGPPPLPRLGT